MAFDYAAAEVWIDDLTDVRMKGGYQLCAGHADRLTPPLGWRLADRRTSPRLFVPLEVA